MARLSKLLVVLALTFSLGAHWILLQSVAWVGMVITYSQQTSLDQALAKTFDGKHPCRLCKAVQEGKQSEQQQERLKVEHKLDFLCAAIVPWFYPPAMELPSVRPSLPLRECLHPPPVPPPRSLQG
jgi:hypothetical protein